MVDFLPALFCMLLASCACLTGKEGVVVAENGGAVVEIVAADEPIPAETFACEELADYLGKVTGAKFTVVKESEHFGKGPAVYLGWTRFAKKHGVDCSKLGEEEWKIRTVGDSLLIAGGRPRGTLYGVYEFLESQAGCHWLAWDTEVAPKNPDLTVGPLDINGGPAFYPREIYVETGRFGTGAARERLMPFLVRNRHPMAWSPEFGGGYLAYGRCHSFYTFVNPKEWFGKHPEYYSMDAAGKRTCGNSDLIGGAGSELCLSNPGLPQVVADSISKHIKESDAKHAKAGLPLSRGVDLGMEDNAAFICKCPECAAISKIEGSESGLLIRFLNKVADLLEKDYPDIQLRTLSYVSTDVPPLVTRPNDNVIVWWCDLYVKSDCFRPLTHPVNREQAELLKGWGGSAKNIHVWDYWNMSSPRSSPAVPDFVSPETTAANLKFFRANHVSGYFAELERGVTTQSFFALSYWAGLRLLDNPDLPPGELTSVFIDGYYGPAAPAIRQYYDFLSAALRDEPTAMNYALPTSGRKYLTMDFLVRCRELLLKAEAEAAPGSPERFHVWREMVVVYNCLLHQWRRLERQEGRKFPFAKSGIADKYEAMRKGVVVYDQYGPALEKALLEDLAREMTVFRNALPLPEQFRKLPEDKVMDFPWSKLPSWALVDDPDAVGGKAVSYSDPSPAMHGKPPVFGAYDRSSKRAGPTLELKAVPADEKYHLYKLGKFSLGPDTIVWGHYTWQLGCVYLAPAYVFADGVKGADPNLWDIHVSAKITGPAYVEGSKNKNAIWVDRVILVKP